MGGIIIGYEVGKLLRKETIFCERVNGKFVLRRGFKIKKGTKVLIIEDVIGLIKTITTKPRINTVADSKKIKFYGWLQSNMTSFSFPKINNYFFYLVSCCDK